MRKYINNWLHKLLGKELDAKVRNYFLKGSYKSLLLQAAVSIFTFLTTIVIARMAGDEGFGIYSLVFTWVSIISVGATLGLDDLVLKQLPVYQTKGKQSKIKGLLFWSNKWGLISGVGAALIFALVVNLFTINGISEHVYYYNIALVSIPFFVLMHINQASLRGLKYLGAGQLAEKVVQPFSFLIILVLAYLLYWSITDAEIILFRVISFGLAALMALYLLYHYLKEYKDSRIKTETTSQVWLSSCKYFAFMSLLYIINTRVDIVFLGFYEIPREQIAYYNVALKLSDIALIPFMVVCTVTTPMFSKLYAENKIKELQAFFTKTTQLACALITLILLAFVLLGPWLLSWYGAEFKEGYQVLMVLCGIKFLHVFVGPVSYLLMMTNLEKQATYSLLVSVAVTVLLHMILIPRYQIEGAAYATLGGLVIFELLVSWTAYKRAGIITTVFGKFLNKKGNPSK
ncbi:MAG: flippase [Aureispira sp.]|nr:flippase [Aureispira sp.]